MTDLDLDELRAELDEYAAPRKPAGRSPREERILAGFEEIQRFVEEHGRPPQHGEDRDIFERLYAVRLDRLRALAECRALLEPLDHQGLLGTAIGGAPDAGRTELDDEALLYELKGAPTAGTDVTELRHVRSSAERRAAEEIANRVPCKSFDLFKPLFLQVQKELDAGVRESRRFQENADIRKGEFFIVGGQKAYVAEVGEEFVTDYDRRDRRLRVIYDNATESDILLRSLQRALYKDDAGRRITDPSAGPLFASRAEDGDAQSGTIYVLRSRSDHPEIAARRTVLHKIGVTGSRIESRIANARLDPTFLMAEVDVIATYDLYNINRSRLEALIHRVFAPARLDIEIQDRFGNPIRPREWFLVPLPVIDDAVERIRNGTIADYRYDPGAGRLEHIDTVASVAN